MNTRIYNARIAKTNEDKTFDIVTGELWVEGNIIKYIGDPVAAPVEVLKWDRQIDAENNLIIPGFKNAHTHTAMTFVRSVADDTSLHQWLKYQIFPREAKLTGDDIYWLNILGNMEYLTSGITTNFDMYLDVERVAQSSIDMGFRTVQVSTMNDFNACKDTIEEDFLKVNEMGKDNGLAKFFLGFHAIYTTNKERMELVARLASKYKSPVYTHNSETRGEIDRCMKEWGKTPTELTNEMGMYEYGGGGYHCVYLSDHDFEIFKKKNLSFVTNIGSNTKLASGFPDVKKCLDMGINLAIGTDGPSSNNALDMFREMHMTCVIPKVTQNDPACMPANEVLYAATTGGAIAMGLDDCDRLEVGKKADLVMIDLQQPNMQPENNLIKNLVYSGSKSNVAMTMIDGKVLYERGKFNIGFEPKEIYAKANEIIRRIG